MQRSVEQFSVRVEPTVAEEPIEERPPIMVMPQSEEEPLRLTFPEDRSGEAGCRQPRTAPTVLHAANDDSAISGAGITLNFSEHFDMEQPFALPLSRANMSYYRKIEARRAAGEDVKRNVRHKTVITCSKCNKPRDKENHSQYYGSWWCRKTSDFDTYESFKEHLIRKGKGKGKKKKKVI